MANKFTMSTKLSLAVSRVMESDPKDWSSIEHSAMIRYLALECSDQRKATVGDCKVAGSDGKVAIVKCLQIDGKPVTAITVNWNEFRAELVATAKVVECANMKKTLSEDYEQFRTLKEKAAEYV